MAQAIGNFADYTAPRQGIYDPLAVGINAFMGGTQFAADRRAQEQERAFVEQQRGRTRAGWKSEDEFVAAMKQLDDEAKQRAEMRKAARAAQPPASAPNPMAGLKVNIPQTSALSAGPQPEVDSGVAVAPMAPPAPGGALGGLSVRIPQRQGAKSPGEIAGAPMVGGALPDLGAAQPPDASGFSVAPMAAPQPRGLRQPVAAYDDPNSPENLRDRIEFDYRRAELAQRDPLRFGEQAKAFRASADTAYRQYVNGAVVAAQGALRGGSTEAFNQWKATYPDMAMAAAVDDLTLLKVEEITTPDGFRQPAYVFADQNGNPLPPVPNSQIETRIASLTRDPEILDKVIGYVRQSNIDAVNIQSQAEQSKRGDRQVQLQEAQLAQNAEQFATEQQGINARFQAQMILDARRVAVAEAAASGDSVAQHEEKVENAITAVDKQYPLYESAVKGAFKTDSAGAIMAGTGGFGEMRLTVNGQTMKVSEAFGPSARIGMDRVAAFAASIEKFSILNNGLSGKKGPADAARLGVIGAALTDLSSRRGKNVSITLEDGRIARLATAVGVPYLQIERRAMKDYAGDVPVETVTEREVYPLAFDLYMSWRQAQQAAPQGAIR